MQLAELVDLSLYPIDRLDDAGEDLLESCRKSLQGSALCYLPNFLTTRGLAQLQAEVMSVQQLAYRNCAPRPPYAWRDQARYPSEHVVAQRLPQSLGSVTRDCFEADRTLVSLFEQDASMQPHPPLKSRSRITTREGEHVGQF